MSIVIRIIIKFVMGTVIFVGLPLVGWGIGDVAGFVVHPARSVYILLIVLMQVFILIKLPEAGSNRSKNIKKVYRKRFILTLLQVIPLAIIIMAPYSDRRDVVVWGNGQALRYLGLCLLFLGFSDMHWAEASLGKQFSVEVAIQEDHKLITKGLYTHLRHPRYLGVLFCFAGIALLFRSGLALILFMGLILVHLFRIHDEEMIMQQEFGTTWEAYRKKTWRLIPFVY